MIQPGEGLGFPLEALRERSILGGLDGQDFERHQAIELGLPCLINDPHAAHADQFDDLQLRKLVCEDGGIRRRTLAASPWFAAQGDFRKAFRAKAFRRGFGHRFVTLLAEFC